uniref:Cell wall protein-like n=1 Tax=Oryza sativa subsp. japonica TaxID=39947 RepID=Q8LME3_ORYSJ|nr:Hypothetical protein [Oryza sativa Japonica Group]
MKARSEIFNSVSDAIRSEKCRHRLPGNVMSWEMIQWEGTHQGRRCKGIHGMLNDDKHDILMMTSMSKSARGATRDKSGEVKIPSANGSSCQVVQRGEVRLEMSVQEEVAEEAELRREDSPTYLLASLLESRGRDSSLRFAGKPPEARPRRQPVALPPLTASSRPCRAAQVQAGRAVFSLGVAASTSTPACPRFRRNAVARAGLALCLAGVPSATPSSVPVHRQTSPAPPPASQRQGCPRPRLPSIRTPLVFVIVVSVRPRRRLLWSVVRPCRLVVSLRRHPRRHRSSVFRAVLVSVQLLPAALITSSPVPVVVLSSFPVVVAFVPPSSRSRPSSASVKCAAAAPSSSSSSSPRRQALCRPRLAFVQRSPPKSSPRRSSPSFLAASAAPVRRCCSHASSRGGKDLSSRCPVLVLSVSPRTRCAVVDPARVVSSGVRLSATRLG